MVSIFVIVVGFLAILLQLTTASQGMLTIKTYTEIQFSWAKNAVLREGLVLCYLLNTSINSIFLGVKTPFSHQL